MKGTKKKGKMRYKKQKSPKAAATVHKRIETFYGMLKKFSIPIGNQLVYRDYWTVYNHEIGHAILALTAGIRLKELVVHMTGVATLGHVYPYSKDTGLEWLVRAVRKGVPDNIAWCQMQQRVLREALTCMAGPVAESIANGEKFHPRCNPIWGSDRESWKALIKEAFPDAQEHHLADIARRSQQFLQELMSWDHYRCLASAMYDDLHDNGKTVLNAGELSAYRKEYADEIHFLRESLIDPFVDSLIDLQDKRECREERLLNEAFKWPIARNN